jgi:hypothetical protein
MGYVVIIASAIFFFLLLFVNLVLNLFTKPLAFKIIKGHKDFKDYRFNKKIFQASIVLICVLWFVLIGFNGFGSKLYYKCPSTFGDVCFNPFYKDCYLNTFISCYGGDIPTRYSYIRDLELLPSGFTMGTPPGLFVAYFTEIFMGVLFLAFILNHLLYNRRRK